MLLYALILFLVAVMFAALGAAIYRGKTDLIHGYHQTRVTDKSAYGRAFGKAMFLMAASFLLSGIAALFDAIAWLAIAILVVGLTAGTGLMIAVQRKYNKGVF